MNNVDLIGRLTKNPELKQTPTGKVVVSFSLAVPRESGKNQADFFNCQAWDKTAELICKYVVKGQQLGVSGNLQTRTWETDGKKNYAVEVNVRNITFISAPKGDVLQPDTSSADAPSDDLFENLTAMGIEEDLPF